MARGVSILCNKESHDIKIIRNLRVTVLYLLLPRFFFSRNTESTTTASPPNTPPTISPILAFLANEYSVVGTAAGAVGDADVEDDPDIPVTADVEEIGMLEVGGVMISVALRIWT